MHTYKRLDWRKLLNGKKIVFIESLKVKQTKYIKTSVKKIIFDFKTSKI